MRYLILQYGYENDRMILRDLEEQPNVRMAFLHPMQQSLWRRGMSKLHGKAARLAHRPQWQGSGWMREAAAADCLIVLACCLVELELDDWEELRKRNPQLRIVLLLWDAMHTHSPMMEAAREKILRFGWDCVLSFDREDCAEFGFTWTGLCYYSRTEEDGILAAGASDLFYIGTDTAERRAEVAAICRCLSASGARSDMVLVPRPSLADRLALHLLHRRRSRSLMDGLRLAPTGLTYREVLAHTLSANCVLELVRPGQRTQTLRYFEAVAYGKKLLTNFAGVRDLPFYDERYMRVFKKAEDIDVDWVKAREPADYGYAGEFSPVRLLGILEERLRL